MTKNPFEIRADILAMAKDYMDKQTALNAEMWSKALSLGQHYPMDHFKTSYTMEELKKVATDMISFVNTK